jgi:UDP-2,4-diacetamido-2,4,6-trideoxy-beta-L-altropyranose hydrolase
MKREEALHFFFRCDAGARHGLGHLMRCLSVASELVTRGHLCSFVVNAPHDTAGRIVDAGFTVISVDKDAGTDIPETWLCGHMDMLIVDSKDVNANYVQQCRTHSPVACFDDEVARSFRCDAIINNHLWGLASDYQVDDECCLLLGPDYNTVSPAYFDVRDIERCGLLISLGGEDPQNHTTWLIDKLAGEMGDLPVHVCIGPAHPSPDSVLEACARSLPHATVYCSPASLLEPISKCHLALSAGGTTCYELAAAGVAMAIVAVEEHQQRMQASLVSRGAALSFGKGSKDASEAAITVFRQLRRNDVACSLARSARTLFARSGVENIAARLIDVARRNG